MAQEKESVRRLEFEPRLVLLFLAIGGPFFLVGCLAILGWLRGEMNRTLGEDMLGGAAADTARYLDTYLLNNLTGVSVIGSTPALRRAAARSNSRYAGDPERIKDRLIRIDEDWVSNRGAVPLALEIVGQSDASEFLREIAAFHPAYKEILLTDRQGALVAATNITSDYYQADESWWRQAFGDGEQGSLYSSDVTFDTSVGGYVMEMGVPVRDQPGDESHVIGVLKVLIDAGDLFSVVSAVKRGDTGHALLVRSEDGTVIAGRDPDDVMLRQYPGLASLRDAVAEGQESFLSRDEEGRVWVASFARMPEPSPFQHYHDWVVVVQQEASEAQAPMAAATLYLVLFFVAIGLLVVIMSLYLHYKLVRPIREIDLREEMDRLTTAESGGGRG
jgi:hypothetical protein